MPRSASSCARSAKNRADRIGRPTQKTAREAGEEHVELVALLRRVQGGGVSREVLVDRICEWTGVVADDILGHDDLLIQELAEHAHFVPARNLDAEVSVERPVDAGLVGEHLDGVQPLAIHVVDLRQALE